MDMETIQDNEWQQPTAQELWELKSALNREHVPQPDMQKEWEKLSERLNLDSAEEIPDTHTPQQPAGRNVATKIIYFLSGVAATVAALMLFNFFNSEDHSPAAADEYFFAANNEKQEITITADGGKPAVVNNPSINLETEKATSSPQPKLLTLATSRGKDYQITLADGTKVWMNAESKLQFPETFKGKTREVILHGEAFFEVAKDANHPFIVKTDYFNTTVLGTSFNVKAYSAKGANVVLVDGSVKVNLAATAKGKAQEATLHPGQQLSVANSQMSINDIDTYPYTQWRDGFFYFENQTLFEIMQELGRWYNVNIAFNDPGKMNVRLHFVCSRSQGIADAVKNMNALGVVDVEYNGKVVTIY